MDTKKRKLVIKFTQQQLELLEKLRKEKKFGEKYADIVLNVFREYTKQDPKKDIEF